MGRVKRSVEGGRMRLQLCDFNMVPSRSECSRERVCLEFALKRFLDVV